MNDNPKNDKTRHDSTRHDDARNERHAHRTALEATLRRTLRAALPLLAALVIAGTFAGASAQTVRVLTHSSFDVPTEILEEFTRQTGITLEFLEGGDAGETVNRAILTRQRPVADVLFGVDNNLIARAQAADLFAPHESEALEHVPGDLVFAPGDVTPVTMGFVTFNYDVAWFEENDLAPPTDITDLAEEAYRGLTVVMNPATSSPGLAFLLTTIARFGDDAAGGWLEYWAALQGNDVLVAEGWTAAYYTHFTRYGGDRPIVLSYATSPAAEVYFASEPLDEAPTANLLCDRCAYRQIEGAAVLQGARDPDAARAAVDFMLSREFQEQVPTSMWVYPVRADALLPDVFRFAEVPAPGQIASVPSADIEANSRAWLQAWTQVVEQGRDPADVR